MTLLAFDTACDACSVALWRAGKIVGHGAKGMVRGQSEELVVMIESVMDRAGQGFAGLAALAVTVGPGAFTGLRIGLATARAIALATGRPAIGVTTFEAIAAAALAEGGDPARAIVVAIDTKRGDLYLQSFRRDDSVLGLSPCHEATVLAPADAAAGLPSGALLLAGDGAASLFAALGGDATRAEVAQARLPDARHIAVIAAGRLALGGQQPPLRPLYLRPPEVRLPAASVAGAAP